MIRRVILAGGLAVFAAAALAAAPEDASNAWVPLYNGRDLTGWHVEGGGAKIDVWKVDGPTLRCLGGRSGYLATDREYGDFELRLQYRASKGANSGVGIRFPKGGWPSTGGMEIQILDDTAPQYANLNPKELNGSIYSFVGPKARPAKPAGEWNRMRILCDGTNIAVWVNDVEVIHENLAEHNEKGKGPLPLSKRPLTGLIGLQCHGDPIDFRGIEVREIVHALHRQPGDESAK